MVDAPNTRSELPQVWQVFIPDPDCKEILSKCDRVDMPVDEVGVQEALWKYDFNHDHVLDASDIGGIEGTTTPAGAARRLSELWVGTQLVSDAAFRFESGNAAVDFARARLAIDRAHETVQFLSGLSSHNVHDGFFGYEHEYNVEDWEGIVSRLGIGGSGYAEQVSAAYSHFAGFMGPAKISDETLTSIGGTATLPKTVDDAWVLDAASLPMQLQGEFVDLARKLGEINSFAIYGEIECEGWSCPSDDGSPNPLNQDQWHGSRIAVRLHDPVTAGLSFIQFATPVGWSYASTPELYWPISVQDMAGMIHSSITSSSK